MSSAGFDPERSPGAPPPAPADSRSQGPLGPDRDLLESVLRQTLADSSDSPTASDLAALGELARKHPGRTLDPAIAAEMVAAVLREPFEALVATAELWRSMVTGIAQTLWEDPVSRDRLQVMWSRLSESAS